MAILWPRWEYLTEIIHADVNSAGSDEYFDKNWPPGQVPPKHTPASMIPTLDERGRDGWELVHMQPVPMVGKEDDIGFPPAGLLPQVQWSNAYFCVFKRPKMPDWEYVEFCRFCMQVIDRKAKVCPYCGREKTTP
jgi:hypothetical protein